MNKKINIFSTFICLICIAGIIAFIYPLSEIIQGDTLWHAKNGEWIIANRKIPTCDYFSYHEDLSFMAHEWLFDLIIYFVSNGGTVAVYLFAIIFTFLTYSYVVFRAKSNKQRLFNAIFLLLLTMSGFFKGIMAIPDTIGAVILVAMGNNLLEKERCFKAKLIINTVLSIVLVNFHGGMMSAAIIQCLFLIGVPCIERFFRKEKSDFKDTLLILSSFVGSLVNPYCIGIYKYGLMVGTEASKYISDWVPFSFTSMLQVFLISLSIVFAIYGSYIRHKKFYIDIRIWAVFLYIVILCMYKRAVNLFIYALFLFAGEFILLGLTEFSKKFKYETVRSFLVTLVSLLCIISSVLVFGNIKKYPIPNQSIKEYLNDNFVSEKAQEYIKNKRIFNILDNGGHLIYLDIPVFIDGRVDPYVPEYGNPDIFMEGYKALYSDERMLKLSYKYGFTILVLDANSTSTQIFIASPNWRVIDYTQNTIILERTF